MEMVFGTRLAQVDLVGGYYDAGDGVKFSFPMAFATTMLAWSVVEFGQELEMAGELHNAIAAIRWSTDYLLKTTSSKPNTIYAQVRKLAKHHCAIQNPKPWIEP
jgi:endoglucanase